MNYEEARARAVARMAVASGQWVVDEIEKIENERDVSTEEAQRIFFAAVNLDELNAVVRRYTAALARVILDPYAPTGLQ